MEKQQTPQQKPQFKRRTIFIKKNLQFRYMTLILLSVLAGLLIMAFELTFTLNDVFDRHPVLLQPLYDHFPALAYSFIYKIIIYVVFVVLISAILSHRMAGPVYRFEQTCKAIAKGDFSQRVHLRKGDQFTELQDEFNKMMDRVEEEINKKK
ncbi:MAG: HAMP domain-containing protein [Elusimicrobiaceae bacterium]|nr:HAMP domain-containing protein [Elusimicrobiaceae bacterium]MBR3899446.1 HAMP domain-containing protein [Elusimicrobiaceae bacterium]